MENKTILILDDERCIREGIALVIREAFPTFRILTAQSGTEAYELICSRHIDISITDIMVPELNGLQLIQRCVEEGRKTSFILLSGYGEFSFAAEAMQYGVRRYLLKPVADEELLESVREAVLELDQRNESSKYITRMQGELDGLRQYALTEYLTDCMCRGTAPRTSGELYKESPLLLTSPIWAASCRFQQTESAVKAVRHRFSGQPDVLVCTMPFEEMVLVICGDSLREVLSVLDTLSDVLPAGTCGIGVSQYGKLADVPRLYQQATAAVERHFYEESAGMILFEQSFLGCLEGFETWELENLQLFIEKVESRCIKEAEQLLEQLYQRLKEERPPVEQAREILDRYGLVVSREKEACGVRDVHRLIGQLGRASTLEEAVDTLKLMLKLYRKPEKIMSETISKMLTCIEEHLHDEDFSLGQMADEMIFMNSVYLGRLFKKEMGITFSQYVMLARVESAKAMLESGKKRYKVYEISKAVGFGDNPQYFSQIFRRCTGQTPSTYQSRFLNESSS